MNQYYKIRPAARLITTIGEDLIKDVHAAIVELVKNSYDADANIVDISFSAFRPSSSLSNKLKIMISDDGHGMDFDTVVNKWMMPATDDKLKRRFSPKGRLMQGRKGIGRYAAAILGEELFMTTTDNDGIQTSLYIDWKEFNTAKYLDDINILIESKKTNEKPGTKLEIIGGYNRLLEWNSTEIEKLIIELKKLISPINVSNYDIENEFSINLSFSNFSVENYENKKMGIVPFPIAEYYDYRLYGNVTENGNAELIFENKSARGIPDEKVQLKIKLREGQRHCGHIKIDFKVYDREKDSLENLIQRGDLKNHNNDYFSVSEARKLLNEISGIAIYRNYFRIRPYGNSGYDWLELDRLRVQNPSLKIGSDQIVGTIVIEPEEISYLEEKSARDGLKENSFYEGLKEIARQTLQELEIRRKLFRDRTLKGGRRTNVERELTKIFDFSGLTKKVENKLLSLNLEKTELIAINNIIKQEEEEKAKIYSNIKDIIAIYQGQATLGKIIMVILHEGRKPLNWFKNTIPVIDEYVQVLKNEYDVDLLKEVNRLFSVGKTQGALLINLFNKLDPLSMKKRDKKKEFYLRFLLEKIFKVFEVDLDKNKIKYFIECEKNIKFTAWEDDFYTCFTNLIDNSIYWLTTEERSNREIKTKVYQEQDNIIIDYYDNGPGIDEKYIIDDLIFEPGISTKTGGTGLGLAIAGEAIERNNGKLKAINNKNGAYFRIELINYTEVQNG